ncbi:structural protein [Flavobacterium phage vB_FspP_elemoA_15-3D]|nr:structural protein [Flavobacterium phage vB_FspP_elemoA_13-1A]QMP87575.1 structural protein [Flavobacterium phage vB_FspP_elemoA_15-3D]QMP88827.1 structural protein [Flavobacterium phage vB_FspP_elemoA_5-9B]QMP88918.1 structural protein [Flavobacterium phage vB_FspP_elemoA_6-5A]
MAKIKNNFLKATVNKDFDERLTPNGQMTDAENVMVISEDNGGVGVLKNVKGNLKVTSLNIANSETIGSIEDDAKNRAFYFVTSPSYDYVIQYNIIDNTTEIVLQSTHGTGVLNFNNEYRISHSDLFISVEGYDLLSWTDGLNPPRIINIERAKTYGIDGFTEDEVSVMKPSPIFAPSVVQVQSTNVDFAGFIRDKFLSFAYRYRYKDGYYSSFSSWSPYAFTPGSFNIDLDTSTNLSMENISKSYQISFNTGPREVEEIELVFKISNSNNVYSIIKLNKADEVWADNFNKSYIFDNYKVYNVLSENEFFRSFDNVPLSAYTQARIGNRLVYGNFVEGRDIDSKVEFSVDYESQEINTLDIEDVGSYEAPDALPSLLDIWGVSDTTIEINGGIDISMNFETNIVTLTNSSADVKYARVVLDIDKDPTYSEQGFDIIVDFWGNEVTGSVPANVVYHQLTLLPTIAPINPGDSKEVKVYVSSLNPVLFKTNFLVRLVDIGSFTYSQKGFDTDGYYQLFSNEDNIINKKSLDIDFTNIPTVDGTQILFEFDIRSYFSPNDLLPPEDNPNLYAFAYTVNGTYLTKEDFITNSNFISDLSTFFLNQLELADSNLPGAENVIVDALITSFNSTTNVLNLIIPNRTIDIEETGSGDVETKIDYVFCEGVVISYSSGTLFTSMHSSRDYEVGMVFLDDKGRKTTVIDAKNNSVYVESSDSVNQNVLKVTTTGTPPSWAKYYKFAVKYNRGKYDTIFTKKIYNVDLFSYLELVGDNKNKVKDGDYLVVKSDLNGPVGNYTKVKVLDAKFYDKDEIVEGSISGFFFKVKAGDFDLRLSEDDFLEFLQTARIDYLYPYYIPSAKIELPIGTPLAFTAGNIVRIVAYSNRARGDRQFRNNIDQEYLLTRDYDDFREVFEDVIEPSNAYQKFAVEGSVKMDYEWRPDSSGRTQIAFRPRTSRDGGRYIRTKTNIYVTKSNIPVFETVPLDSDDNIYIETPRTYVITNGQYQFTTHTLSDVFNCYCFGNGVESISVRDEMTTNFLNLDYSVNAVSEDVYRQVNRYADLTYSGVYQESTNVNRLNEFNLSLANYKDDLEKRYGSIIRLDSDQTDLLVIQEDKWSKVLYGKDLLYNTDATTNLSRIEDVLGQQVLYAGEYGISSHPESYDDYGTNAFCTDDKRGVILGMNNSNGLSEISNSGMRDYFKTLFRDNEIVNVIGQYDAFFDIYIMNIKYKIKGKDYTYLPVKYDYVTWSYSPEVNGFLGRQSFDPDSMLRVNNEFLSFKGADVYKHNVGPYNNFYGTSSQSSFAFNFNEEPSARKIFKTISIEGNSPWTVNMNTDMQNGYIAYSDFVNKEGVYYSYIRGNDSLDLSTISVTGLGIVQNITGGDYFLSEVPSSVSVGDKIYITNGSLFGTVSAIGPDYITISPEPILSFTVSVGDFILSAKPSSIETSGIRGYYMNTRFNLQTTGYAEVYAINSEALHSFE